MEKGNVLKIFMQNYIRMEASIVEQLKFSVTHDATIGVYRENVWKSLFKQIVHKKFTIEQSVFIIDSKRNVSKERNCQGVFSKCLCRSYDFTREYRINASYFLHYSCITNHII